MQLKELTLRNFRNHTKLHVQITDNPVFIIGDNGIGKTNILEAIHLLSLAKSPLARYDVDLIQHSADFANLECVFEKDNDETKLQLNLVRNENYDNKSAKKLVVNGVSRSHAKFIGNLHTSIFTPEDLSLITGSPTTRRMYIDSILVQTSQDYKTNLTEYKKVVKRRNKLLENINKLGTGHAQLEYWNDKLLITGTAIQDIREELFEHINTTLSQHLAQLDKDATCKLIYQRSNLTEDKLDKISQYEIRAMRTLVGPHRDNFTFELNSYDAGHFSSRGQKRTVLLAVKMCELDYFVTKLAVRPILLLDDIFSELDDKHRDAVLNVIRQQQTFITTTRDINDPGQKIILGRN